MERNVDSDVGEGGSRNKYVGFHEVLGRFDWPMNVSRINQTDLHVCMYSRRKSQG